MKRSMLFLIFLQTLILLKGQTVIYCPSQGAPGSLFAARELRRYIYQRTGEMALIQAGDKLSSPYAHLIVLMVKDQKLPKGIALPADLPPIIASLKHEEFCLRSFLLKNKACLLIAGGDSTAMLYGAYRFAEVIGIRFFLHGDVIPDVKAGFAIPEINEVHKPLFSLRGILPFHDFPEGPDWWERENYLLVVEQLVKLRMNFLGLHTYTDNGDYVRFEPTVWQGLPGEYNNDGTVKKSYPAKYANTGLFSWGYRPRKTSEYSWGASIIFEKDYYTSSVMDGLTPVPASPEQMNRLFNRTGELFKEVFTYARSLGIKTCTGTEVPITIHYTITDEMKKNGKNPRDPVFVEEMYKGIFGRIEKTYPLDYYWLWTGEGWTWNIPAEEEQKEVLFSLQAAVAVHRQLNLPFRLALCGWVLGPPQDRLLFDRVLPQEMPFSCINRYVGYAPVDVAFASLNGRDKWAIPWLEDDPRLTSPQLWVGRVRRDAADALAYGCNGLMGIHWRTCCISPMVAALAQAGWSQAGWNKKVGERWTPVPVSLPAIEGTDDDPLYGTLCYNPAPYEFSPGEPVSVTLKFCELQYNSEKQRVFDIVINDSVVREGVDVFKLAGGKNKAFDVVIPEVKTPSRLSIRLVRKEGPGYPMLSALAIEGKNFKKKINCGGERYKDYEKDLLNEYNPRHPYYGHVAERENPPYLKEIMDYKPVADLYVDWCQAMFGPEIAAEASRIFSSLDGNFPVATEWRTGPGNIRLIKNSWEEEEKKYLFVENFERLKRLVKGEGNTERYLYWLGMFKYQRALARMGCLLSTYYALMEDIMRTEDAYKKKDMLMKKALPLRIELNKCWGEAQTYLLESVVSTGEMGMIANLENHSMAEGTISRYDSVIKAITWQDLPPAALPSKEYSGRLRIFSPAVRNTLFKKENFVMKCVVLGRHDESSVCFWWKKMGAREPYQKIIMQHVARGVYQVVLPAPVIGGNDFEYYISASAAGSENTVTFPVTAPQLNHTVVIIE